MSYEIEQVNKRLRETFGLDSNTGRSMWRVVFSRDEFEKRLMYVNDSGVYLLQPEVREVPKYRHYIKDKWVLEQLVLVPDFQRAELGDLKLSYEPMWTFETASGEILVPTFEGCKFIIDSVHDGYG